MKRNRKWKIPHTLLEKRTLRLSSYRNCKLKVKLWEVGARKRKKRASFVLLILSEGNFFNICVSSQCITYWTIHIFYISKNINSYTFLLILKSPKTFSVSLRWNKKHFSSFIKGAQLSKSGSELKMSL